MECSRIDTILNDHRQGELGAADKAACEAHLLVCSHCADAVFSYELLASETAVAGQRPVDGPDVRWCPHSGSQLLCL
jgi:anti-sigma factor RsiW